MNYDENVFKEKPTSKPAESGWSLHFCSQPTMVPMPQTACIRFLITLFL